jgi:cytochrome c oxidase cbb3-type subunit 3
MNKKIKIKALSFFTTMLISCVALAQDTTKVEEASISGFEFMMIGIAAVLLLAVALLGLTYVKLVKYKLEKLDKALLIAILLTALPILTQAQDVAAPVNEASAMSVNMLVMGGVIFLELLAAVFLLFKINSLINIINPSPSEAKEPFFSFSTPDFWDKFNASTAIEKEKDIMLDHDYDGIKELDNNLPPWWLYSFYVSIVWAFLYMGYYHVFGGPSSIDTYQEEMELAKAEKEAHMLLAKNNVDENSVEMAEGAALTDGKQIYTANCAACHGANGEGGVGPNMTDDYWLHGGDLKAVFTSVKYGIPAMGMKAWESDLTPVQMQNVSSYIMTLKGTNPANPKEPQGELISASVSPTVDSVAVSPN